MYAITTVSDTSQIEGIHQLQKRNLKSSLTVDEISSEGFVTCDHTVSLLSRMNSPYPHVISLYRDQVVGYTLVMLEELREEIDVLVSMFDQIDTIIYKDSSLNGASYFVMGQVCISREHRSQGLFNQMYHHMKTIMRKDFDFCITEIATDNMRSRKAHRRVGFKHVHTYIDEMSGQSWELVLWDWR